MTTRQFTEMSQSVDEDEHSIEVKQLEESISTVVLLMLFLLDASSLYQKDL